MDESRPAFWITPVAGDELKSGEEIVHSLVGEKKRYGLGRHTSGRKSIKRGDWICFYVTRKGVVGYARLSSNPELRADVSPLYPINLTLEAVRLRLEVPVPIDSAMRKRLDAFKTRSETGWGWFVTSTHRISEHDFRLLVGAASNPG